MKPIRILGQIMLTHSLYEIRACQEEDPTLHSCSIRLLRSSQYLIDFMFEVIQHLSSGYIFGLSGFPRVHHKPR